MWITWTRAGNLDRWSSRWKIETPWIDLHSTMFHAFYVSWFVVFFSTEIFKIVASWGLNKYINDIDMQRRSGRSDAVAGSEFCRVPFESFQIHIGTLTHRHIDTFTTSIGWHVEIKRHQTAWMALACYGGRWQALVASDFRMSNFRFFWSSGSWSCHFFLMTHDSHDITTGIWMHLVHCVHSLCILCHFVSR